MSESKTELGQCICDCCGGDGEIITRTVCSKCFGEGKLDWVENIVGKRNKSNFHTTSTHDFIIDNGNISANDVIVNGHSLMNIIIELDKRVDHLECKNFELSDKVNGLLDQFEHLSNK